MDYALQFVNLIFSEYGAFVCFLLLNNAVLLYVIKNLWSRIERQDDRFFTSLENNTRVMTQIVERLEDH